MKKLRLREAGRRPQGGREHGARPLSSWPVLPLHQPPDPRAARPVLLLWVSPCYPPRDHTALVAEAAQSMEWVLQMGASPAALVPLGLLRSQNSIPLPCQRAGEAGVSGPGSKEGGNHPFLQVHSFSAEVSPPSSLPEVLPELEAGEGLSSQGSLKCALICCSGGKTSPGLGQTDRPSPSRSSSRLQGSSWSGGAPLCRGT